MRCDRKSKEQARKSNIEKGVPGLLGTNLTYLLRLGQVTAHEDLPPYGKDLTGSPNRHCPRMVHRALDNISRRLSVRAPIAVMPGLLKITLSLGFLLDHQYDLGTCLHQFGMGQHNYTAWKVMKARTDTHQVIAGGDAAPFIGR